VSNYSPTEHLITSLYLGRDREVLIPMLALYLDDSGTGPTQDVAVAAGFIGTLQGWKRFERAWNKIKGVESQKFECMHMTDFVWDKKKFKNWGDLAKKQTLISKLTRAITDNALKGFTISVVKSEYDELVPDALRKQGFDNHYTYAVRIVAGMIQKWRIQTQRQDKPVHYVSDYLERGDPKRTELENVFTTIGNKDENFKNYGLTGDGISFTPRCDLVSLQAADMLAWTSYRIVRNELGLDKLNPIAKQCFTDFYKHDFGTFLEGGYHKKQHLEEWVKRKGY